MRRHTAWAGLLISLLIVLLLVWRIDLTGVIRDVRRLGWMHWAIGAGIYLTAFLPRGLRWKIMLPESDRLPLGWVTRAVVIGYAANNLLPFRLGEVVRSYIVGNRFNLSKLTCLGTIAAEKVLDGCCLLGMLAASLPFIRIQASSVQIFHRMFWVAALLFGTAIISCFTLTAWDRQILLLVDKRCPATVARLCRAGMAALAIFKKPKTLAGVVGLTLIVWLIESVCFVYFMNKLGIEDAWPKGVFCLVIVNLSILVPSAPGYVGVFQAGTVAAFLALGQNSSAGLALGVATHAAQFIPTTLIGLGLASSMGLTWRRLYHLKHE